MDRLRRRRSPVVARSGYDCSDFRPEDHPEYQRQSIFNCAACVPRVPDGISPREYMHLEVGWTSRGLQVWCKRCERNVLHLDFEGRKVAVAPPGEAA